MYINDIPKLPILYAHVLYDNAETAIWYYLYR